MDYFTSGVRDWQTVSLPVHRDWPFYFRCVTLVCLPSVQYLVDCGDEGRVALAQLVDQRAQRVHGRVAQLRSGVQAPDDWVDDPGGQVRQVERLAQSLQRLQCASAERMPGKESTAATARWRTTRVVGR